MDQVGAEREPLRFVRIIYLIDIISVSGWLQPEMFFVR